MLEFTQADKERFWALLKAEAVAEYKEQEVSSQT